MKKSKEKMQGGKNYKKKGKRLKLQRRKLLIRWFCALSKLDIELLRNVSKNWNLNSMKTKISIGIYIGQTPWFIRNEFRRCKCIKGSIIILVWVLWLIKIIFAGIWSACKRYFTKNTIFSQGHGFCHQTPLILNNNLIRRKQKLSS